jgi:acetate kinase
MQILTINTGSSSLKAALYELSGAERRLLSFGIDAIGQSQSRVSIEGGNEVAELATPVASQHIDHECALRMLLDALSLRGLRFEAVGHRFVYGGPDYHQPTRIDAAMLAALQAFAPRDPQHMPQALHAAKMLASVMPQMRQVACFDTAFHHSMPDNARKFALPQRYFDAGIRRYGFHGLSYEYIIGELQRVDPSVAAGRVIVAHLGSGSSMTAILDGKSLDTSMGFTPDSGLVMSTRTGDIDAAVVLHLMEEGMSTAQTRALLGLQSGLLGISASSADMRQLLAAEATDTRAQEAIDKYCYVARKYLGAYVAVLGGVDALVFTGGIGERAASIRERICRNLHCLGIQLDTARNREHAPVISSDHSAVMVRVIPTNEGLMVARHTAREIR